MIETIKLLTITNPSRCIGIESTEIIRAVIDISDSELEKDAVGELVSSGRFFRLEEIMSNNPETDFRSILILGTGAGNEYAVSVAGTIDIVSVGIKDIIPVPEYIKKRQDPFFVWGFMERSFRLVTLVTFRFMKGAL